MPFPAVLAPSYGITCYLMWKSDDIFDAIRGGKPIFPLKLLNFEKLVFRLAQLILMGDLSLVSFCLFLVSKSLQRMSKKSKSWVTVGTASAALIAELQTFNWHLLIYFLFLWFLLLSLLLFFQVSLFVFIVLEKQRRSINICSHMKI